MVQSELRILVATLGTFAALFGVALVIHGLFFDLGPFVTYGAAIIAAGVVALVVMLTLHPKDLDQTRHRET